MAHRVATTTTPPRWPRPLRAALAVAVVVGLIAVNVWVVCSPLYLRFAFGPLRPTDAALAGPPAFVAAAAVATTDFVAGRSPRSAIESLVVGEATSSATTGPWLYTPSEIDHLTDVRRVIRTLFGLGLACAAAIALALMADGRTRRRRTLDALAVGGRLSVGVTIVAGVLIGGAWNALFTTFHRLLFSAGTWQFPADSRLIQLFPDWFWQSAAAVLALLLLVEGLVLSRVARQAGPPA